LAFSSDLAAILALSSLLTAGNAFGQPAEFALIPAAAGSRPVTEASGIVEAARYRPAAVGEPDGDAARAGGRDQSPGDARSSSLATVRRGAAQTPAFTGGQLRRDVNAYLKR
jgi:hypothetical protein